MPSQAVLLLLSPSLENSPVQSLEAQNVTMVLGAGKHQMYITDSRIDNDLSLFPDMSHGLKRKGVARWRTAWRPEGPGFDLPSGPADA